MRALVRRRLLVRLAMLADLVIFIAALLAAFWANALYSATGKFVLSKVLHLQIEVMHAILLSLAMLGWHSLFRLHRLYESRRIDDDASKLRDVVQATTWGTAICIGIAYVSKVRIITPSFIFTFWFTGTILALLLRYLLAIFLVRMRQMGRNLRYVVIVGTNNRAYKLAQMLEGKKSLGYRIVGYVDDIVHITNTGVNLLGTLSDLPSILKANVVDELIITLPVKSYYGDIQRIVQLAEEQGIRARCLADIFETNSREPRGESGDLSSTIAITGHQKEWHLMAIKRAEDIVLAFFLLLLALPVMLAAAVAIRITSPGPILFVQTRVGFNKRRFDLYKFRTMVVNAEDLQRKVEHLNEMDGPVFKINNDPRVTPVGKWLRKTSIDELPQLFNVLKGDMSLVGPRPLPERDYRGFSKDWQRKRFSVQPGITCIWQVSGRNNIAFDEWMKMDMEYIDNWTPLYDLKILLKTIPAVIRRKGAA